LLRQVCQSRINEGAIAAIEPDEDVVDRVEQGESSDLLGQSRAVRVPMAAEQVRDEAGPEPVGEER
jgi:hypothetical protein